MQQLASSTMVACACRITPPNGRCAASPSGGTTGPFAGSDAGGDRAVVIYTLIETAQLNDIDPGAWLADVPARLSDHPAKQVHQHLPWNWRAATRAAA
jgi:transposase